MLRLAVSVFYKSKNRLNAYLLLFPSNAVRRNSHTCDDKELDLQLCLHGSQFSRCHSSCHPRHRHEIDDVSWWMLLTAYGMTCAHVTSLHFFSGLAFEHTDSRCIRRHTAVFARGGESPAAASSNTTRDRQLWGGPSAFLRWAYLDMWGEVCGMKFPRAGACTKNACGILMLNCYILRKNDNKLFWNVPQLP